MLKCYIINDYNEFKAGLSEDISAEAAYLEFLSARKDLKESILVIAHCNAKERAMNFKKMIEEKYNFQKIEIVETGMLSSVYANNGGIIIAF